MKSICITGILCLLLSLGGEVLGSEKTGPVDFTVEPLLSSEWACYLRHGDLFVKRVAAKDAIEIKKIGGDTSSILAPALLAQEDLVYVVWGERVQGGTRTLFRALRDQGKALDEIVVLSDGKQMPQLRLLADGRGRVYVLETLTGRDSDLAVHVSEDRGKTFKRIPLKVEGMELLSAPAPVVAGDALFLFSFSEKGGKRSIGVRSFQVPTLKPQEDKLLTEAEGISFVDSFTVRETPVVMYKASRQGRFFLEGFRKEGPVWSAFGIKEAEGLDVARIDYQVWASEGDSRKRDRILVVFSGEEKGKFKQRVYAAGSDDLGSHWDVTRIDTREFDNTRAWLPRVAADGDRVVALWEDSRDIRALIRMRISSDRGRTWKAKDFPVSQGRYHAFRPRTSFAKGAFVTAWNQFRDDERKTADLVLEKFTWDEAVKRASRKEKGLSNKEKEALLKKRVDAYWKGMMKKDLRTTYGITDPFYRARIPFDSYSSQRGPMVYHAYTIEGTRIEGNEGFVKIKVSYEIPKMTLHGKETSVPRKEVSAEDAYLFVDGTWYRKFTDALTGGSAVDY